jgi:linoleoyl-CoA desaturase
MNNYASIKFARGQHEFFTTLSQRVNQYFKANNIDKNANAEMVIKTICMFSFYLIPYFVLILYGVESIWMMLGLFALMGFGKAGIGLSVMHDANHGGYSTKLWVNRLLGFSMNMIGGSAFNWKLQHNVLHHTYTNVHDVDEDISPRGVLRMAPESKWHPMHRFQHWYAWFFYGLLTLVWILITDYARLARYAESVTGCRMDNSDCDQNFLRSLCYCGAYLDSPYFIRLYPAWIFADAFHFRIYTLHYFSASPCDRRHRISLP